MHPELLQRHREIEDTILTKEEETLAIWEAKIKKWNEERNREYWQGKEAEKKTKSVDSPMKNK